MGVVNEVMGVVNTILGVVKKVMGVWEKRTIYWRWDNEIRPLWLSETGQSPR